MAELTIPRSGENEERKADRIDAIFGRLGEYPEDAVLLAIRRWPERSKFWPTWHELKEDVDAIDLRLATCPLHPDDPGPEYWARKPLGERLYFVHSMLASVVPFRTEVREVLSAWLARCELLVASPPVAQLPLPPPELPEPEPDDIEALAEHEERQREHARKVFEHELRLRDIAADGAAIAEYAPQIIAHIRGMMAAWQKDPRGELLRALNRKTEHVGL